MGEGGPVRSYVQKRGPWWKMSLLKRNADIYIAAAASIEKSLNSFISKALIETLENIQEDYSSGS